MYTLLEKVYRHKQDTHGGVNTHCKLLLAVRLHIYTTYTMYLSRHVSSVIYAKLENVSYEWNNSKQSEKVQTAIEKCCLEADTIASLWHCVDYIDHS